MAGAHPTLPKGYNLLHLSEVDSTSSEATRRGDDPKPLWIWADRQTSGRGRRGREWVSQDGNLFCTLCLNLEGEITNAARLSFVAAIAAADTVASFVSGSKHEVKVKWPNDVLLKQKKIVGILLESTTADTDGLPVVVLSVGIGINLASHPEIAERPATSLKAENIPVPGTGEALTKLAHCFDEWFLEFCDKGFEPIRKAWLARAKGVGQDIEVRLPNQTLRGVFRDLDPTGALVLDAEDGSRRLVSAGEVFFNSSDKGD